MISLIWSLVIAAVLGAAWRRWFGSERPSWAHTGYRATQIIAGMAVLSTASNNFDGGTVNIVYW